MKKIFLVFVSLLTLSVLPISAAKWYDAGEEFGMQTGMYLDLDAITDSGDQMPLVYKFTNSKILEAFSYMNPNKPKLSVCLMQATFSCQTGLPGSGAILCYDTSGQPVIDEVYSEGDGKDYSKYAHGNNGKIDCQEFRKIKNIAK